MLPASKTQVIPNDAQKYSNVKDFFINKWIPVHPALFASAEIKAYLNKIKLFNDNGNQSRTLVTTNRSCNPLFPETICRFVYSDCKIPIVWISGDKEDNMVFSVSTNQVDALMNTFSFSKCTENGVVIKKWIYFKLYYTIY